MADPGNLSGKINLIGESFTGQVVVRIVTSLLILLVGFIVGRLVGKLVSRVLHELEVDSVLNKLTGAKISLEKCFTIFCTYMVYFISVIMALNQLGVTTTILHILVGGAVILIVLSIIVAVKDFVPNAFAGFFLFKKNELQKGDSIKFKGADGIVKKVGLTEIVLENKDRELIHIPASALAKNEFTVIKKTKENRK